MSMLRALAVVLALVAVGLMIVAIAGMVTGRQTARTGFAVRAGAVICFATAVVLNVIAH
jgi:hypothetical protein